MEAPSYYPNVKSFIDINSLLRSKTSEPITVATEEIESVKCMLTPPELLKSTQFAMPEVIDVKKYPNFDSLLKDRDKVKLLQLVPIRKNEDRNEYREIPKKDHLKIIQTYLKDSPFAMEVNLHPYNLPADLEQYIVWLSDENTPPEEAATFIAQVMKSYDLSADDIVLFERSQKAESKFVRGTIPQIRHIHLWMRKKEDMNKIQA